MPPPPADVSLPLKLAIDRRVQAARCLEAAIEAEYHNAVAQLIQQLRMADLQVAKAQAAKKAASTKIDSKLTPEQAAAALVQQVMDSPLKVKWQIYRRIQEAHPNFEEQE